METHHRRPARGRLAAPKPALHRRTRQRPRLALKRPRRFGDCLAACRAWEQLGLCAFWDERLASPLAPGGAADDWNTLLADGRLTAEDLLRRYTRQVHAQSGGNIEETARRLDQDRRTVKARLG